ncbi:MAG: glycosyltransferase [Planctomycetes bacterium]|nr:glycosyltransferase [Planctomycetota bacterium]
MPKFILIDQSLTDVVGHHYEYACRVLEAARELGYRPILATHRRYQGTETHHFLVFPIYRYRCLEQPIRIREALSKLVSLEMWRRLSSVRQIVQIFGRRFAGANATPPTIPADRTTTAASSQPALPAEIRKFVTNSPAPDTLGVRRGQNGSRRGLANIFSRILTLPMAMLMYPLRYRQQLLRPWRNIIKRCAFANDTCKLLRRIQLDDGDIVFLPMLTDVEMLGLLKYYRRNQGSKKASWHLLFRWNIYAGRDPQYSDQDHTLRRVHQRFCSFTKKLSGQRVFLYTDTDQLSHQYNRLAVSRFRTLPIPVAEDFRSSTPPTSDHPVLTILYAGDARTEKGYAHLPHIVRNLWPDYIATGRVRFTIQSHFNIREGEPLSARARAVLQAYPPDRVNLLFHPLHRHAYRDLITSADIVLITYDRDEYYARSSGIFAEALVAGLPVIVPSGSWMSLQLNDAIHEYHNRLVSNSSLYSELSPDQLQWRDDNAPDAQPYDHRSDRLLLHGLNPISCCFLVPRGATHLLCTFQQTQGTSGHFVNVQIRLRSEAGETIRQAHHVIGGQEHMRCSALFRIDPPARRARLEISSAFSHGPLSLAGLGIRFLSLNDDPQSAVGMVYHEPHEIPAAIREIADHYPHYRRSVGAFSETWAAFHNAARLCCELTSRAAQPEQPMSAQATLV